jgi:uncharacterized Rmd1/YagE family protein
MSGGCTMRWESLGICMTQYGAVVCWDRSKKEEHTNPQTPQTQ